ncbi:hypothetical protein [Tritonibacter mobilis]|uniref:hypothetical protein n=1 Tax=Tritonibacter mobilis TaxID=379347 RepID=UPI001CDA1F8D|nr:hypothetical protein [Tritonibacter mobilis]MCA2007498.1 hypothetical protein [Tritonibacter mobilis]
MSRNGDKPFRATNLGKQPFMHLAEQVAPLKIRGMQYEEALSSRLPLYYDAQTPRIPRIGI